MSDFTTLDPRIIQGLLTLIATLVASFTALWIAYKAYPAQKSADRALQKEHERREVYRRFLQAANCHYARLTMAHWSKSLDGVTESYLSLVTGAADLAAYALSHAKNDVLSSCQLYFQRLLEYGTVVEAACGKERAKEWVSKDPERYPKSL